MLGQGEQQLVIAFTFARAKAATMNADDSREGAVALFRLRQIDLEMLFVGIGEFEVTREGDIGRDHKFCCVDG